MREKKFYMAMDQHAQPSRTTPLQSTWSIGTECYDGWVWVIYLFIAPFLLVSKHVLWWILSSCGHTCRVCKFVLLLDLLFWWMGWWYSMQWYVVPCFITISISLAVESPHAMDHSIPAREGNPRSIGTPKGTCRTGLSGHYLERSRKVPRPFYFERSLQTGQSLEESSKWRDMKVREK